VQQKNNDQTDMKNKAFKWLEEKGISKLDIALLVSTITLIVALFKR
jgi:hypothetical protein